MMNHNHKRNFNRQEEPKCVICSTSFYFRDPVNPTGIKCPHILHCGHSACEGCLTYALAKSNILKCPVCTTVSEAKKLIDPKNMKKAEMLALREDFPLNVYAVGQVSLKKNRPMLGEGFIKFSSKNKKMTDTAVNCNECFDRPADCSCRQCETDLCSSCFSNIHNSVTLRKHEKISLEEKQANELFEDNMCKMHKGLFLNIFCKDCEIYVCKECMTNHLEHRCTDTFQQNEDKLPEFSELFDEANEVLKQLHATKKKIQQPGHLQDDEAHKVERQVQVHYSYLHGMLQWQEEELLKKIRSVGETTKRSLESVVTNLEQNIKEVENMLAISSCTITSNKIKEFPLECLLEKLRNIIGTPCHLVLDDEETSKFELHIDSKITEVLVGHCTVDVPSKRVYGLRSKDELPESYKVESLKHIQDLVLKPDLNLVKTVKAKEDNPSLMQKALLSAIAPDQMEAKTKPQDSLRRNKMYPQQKSNMGSRSGSVQSVSSQGSVVDRLCKLPPLAEGASEIVRMCHLLSPSSFYVQRKCTLGEIEKIREHFSKNANRSRNPPVAIEFGQMYLVYFDQDKNWYRGRVVRVDGNFCDIFYVDYGNTEKRVPKNKIRDIPDRYAEVPDQALHCGLHNCTPANGKWSVEANQLIMVQAYSKDLSMFVERINPTTGFHEVVIRTAEDISGSLTDALIYSGYATITENTAKENGLFKQSAFGLKKNAFKNTVIKDHEVFDGQVTHINSPSNFYIQKIADGGEVMIQLMRDLNETYSRYGPDEGKVFTPVIGMAVAARFHDGSWYRAAVLSLPELRKVQVKYVDFGNVAVIKLEDIRELQPKFMRMGAQALKCSLNDIASKHPKGWPASAKTAFEKLVHNKGLLRVYVEKVKDDNSLSIVLYETQHTKYINISGVLVKKGHALSTGRTSAQAEYACRPHYEVNHQHTDLMASDSESVYSEISGPSKVSGSDKSRELMNSSAPKVQPLLVQSMDRDCGTPLEVPDRPDESFDNRVKIEVLKVMSPSEIYVASGSTLKQIKKLIKEMTVFYTSQLLVEERDWTAGDLCAVLNEDDQQWYRGVITEISHTNYKVFIKDIVKVVHVGVEMLRTLESKFCNVPDGSIKVHLGGLKVPAALKAWPSSTSDYLRRLIEESESLYIEKLGDVVLDSIPVRLWRRTQKQGGPLEPLRDEWCDVNESLFNLGFALLDQVADEGLLSNTAEDPNDKFIMNWLDDSFQRIHEQQLKENTVVKVAAEAPYVSDLEKEEPLSVRSAVTTRGSVRTRANRGRFSSQRAAYIPTVMVPEPQVPIIEWKPAAPFKDLKFTGLPTYVDYDCNIYIQDINSESTLDLLEKAFLSLFENSEKRPYENEYLEGQICVAFFEPTRKWYRGRVLKVKPEHIEVLFVDYGNVEELQPEELRKQVTMGHIPIQCHKCRTEGIIPISPDGKWPIRTLDFIHAAVVDQRCEVTLKPPTDTCKDYVLLSLKLPAGEDLLETLLSMHYATYAIDCEQINLDDEEIIEDQEIQLALSNNAASRALAQEIQKVCSSSKNSQANGNEVELIEDHVKSLQISDQTYDWYSLVENEVEISDSPDITSELIAISKMDLRYRDMILPDSMVEFKVEVQTICSYNSLKVIITECEEPEIMAYIHELTKLQLNIQEEAESMPRLKYPTKDLACIGCYTGDDTWYRAVIKDVTPGGDITVYYVDYGNVEGIPLSRLREIKSEWTLMPVQAFQVALYNVKEGPHYEAASCHAAYMNCLMNPPYTMVIETRFPQLQVELYNDEGDLAYKPLLEFGLITKE